MVKTSKEAPIMCSKDGQLKSQKEQCNSLNEHMIIHVQGIKETRTVKLKKVSLCHQ